MLLTRSRPAVPAASSTAATPDAYSPPGAKGSGETTCRAAGTTLKNAVRIQQFHSDLADLPAALEVWAEATDNMPLPLSPVEVPWLPVPGARLQLDLWVYVPA